MNQINANRDLKLLEISNINQILLLFFTSALMRSRSDGGRAILLHILSPNNILCLKIISQHHNKKLSCSVNIRSHYLKILSPFPFSSICCLILSGYFLISCRKYQSRSHSVIFSAHSPLSYEVRAGIPSLTPKLVVACCMRSVYSTIS